MTWKAALIRAIKHETKPMHQCTYWFLFLSCCATYVIGVISGTASASYALILENPEIAHASWLITGLF